MGSKNWKIHTLNMGVQAGRLRSYFPDSSVQYTQNKLTWTGDITPSPLSDTYTVKVKYVRGKNPNVYVMNPKLPFASGETCLPHVYSTPKQWLCIYHRKSKEWNSGMALVDSVLPWTSEWLLHYEIWLVTGEWHGGGIEHGTELEKSKTSTNE